MSGANKPSIVPTKERIQLTEFKPEYSHRFQCQHCGRFAHFISSYPYYNGSFTDLILEWNCSKCGYCKEGQW